MLVSLAPLVKINYNLIKDHLTNFSKPLHILPINMKHLKYIKSRIFVQCMSMGFNMLKTQSGFQLAGESSGKFMCAVC